MNDKKKLAEQNSKNNDNQLNIGIDPLRTPILFTDTIRVTSSENGFVLDIAQGLAGTNQAVVVARIGLSKEHAKKLAEMMLEQVAKQGIIITSKAKIIN